MPAFPFKHQIESVDCGPTCLAMICKYYNRNISIERIRSLVAVGKSGSTLASIVEGAEQIGFKTLPVQLTFEALTKQLSLPAILHWNQDHYVVLYKIKKRKLLIADPAVGLLSLSPEEFKQHWISTQTDGLKQGVGLILEKGQNFNDLKDGDTDVDSKENFKFANIFNYTAPFKKLLIHLIIGLLVGCVLQLVLPFLTQSIVDVGIRTSNIHFVYIVLIGQIAILAGRLMVDFIRSWILMYMNSRINVSILTDFFIKMMKLPMSFFDSKQTGDILQRMSDQQRIEAFLTGSSLNALFSMLTLVVFSIVLAIYNSKIFFVFLMASLLYVIWVFVFLKKRKVIDHKRFVAASKQQSAIIQMIIGMQEIKLTGCERSMRWKWERLQTRLFKLKLQNLKISQWQQSGAFFINEGKNLIITFLAAKAVIDGQITLGTMLAIQYIIGQLNSPIEQMIGFLQSWQVAKISFERLSDIHKMQDEEPSHKNLLNEIPSIFSAAIAGGLTSYENVLENEESFTSLNHKHTYEYHNYTYEKEKNSGALATDFSKSNVDEHPDILFENVSFTYAGAGNQPVLQNINLKIPKGKVTAIVGSSGSGKTTLLKLLLKFYEPQSGDIYLRPDPNNIQRRIPLSNIRHSVWRKHCGTVMQDSFIFSDSIARNIVIGDEKVDEDKLANAIIVSNLSDFIDTLPLGLNTKIGPDGVGISMGQRQRVLIARSVYTDPDFIFFDEATNSLDANNESLILKNLESFFLGRTVIVVAHRLSTVKNADQIILLNKGIIKERGIHKELINLKGEYYSLVKNQLDLEN